MAEYANHLTKQGHNVSLVIPKGTLDSEVHGELDSRINIFQSKVPLHSPDSIINKLTIAWSLSRTVPPSDIIFSTHTPTIPSAWLAARVWQKAKLFWLYQDYLEMFEGKMIEQRILLWGANWHDKILTISEWSRQELKAFTSKDPIVVGEGLSHVELFYPRPDLRNKLSRKSIMFVGDMRSRKGLQDFLAATEKVYQNIPNIELWIVSKDDCNIETPIPLQFIYRPARSQLAELYASCDLFVSASWWESFGLPPLEAMACGAPTVLTDSRGVREYARHGENCLMVSSRNPQALAEAMQRVLTDSVLAERLRQNGPPTAARFTWEAAVDRFEVAIQII